MRRLFTVFKSTPPLSLRLFTAVQTGPSFLGSVAALFGFSYEKLSVFFFFFFFQMLNRALCNLPDSLGFFPGGAPEGSCTEVGVCTLGI